MSSLNLKSSSSSQNKSEIDQLSIHKEIKVSRQVKNLKILPKVDSSSQNQQFLTLKSNVAKNLDKNVLPMVQNWEELDTSDDYFCYDAHHFNQLTFFHYIFI